MNKKSNKRRITFRLSAELYKQLDNYSIKCGSTKSSIIKQWIASTHTHRIFSRRNENNRFKTSNFNLVIPEEKYKKLRIRLYELQMSLSEYIRSLILVNLNKNRADIQYDTDKIKSLLQQSRFAEIKSILPTSIDELNNDLLFILAKSNLGTQNYNNCREVLELLSRRRSELSLRGSLQVEVLRLELKASDEQYMIETEEITSLLHFAKQIKDRSLIGSLYIRLGKHFLTLGRKNKAILYFLKALEYLDSYNNPIEILDMYMKLARLHEGILDINSAKTYLRLSKPIIERTGNLLYKSQYLNHMALIAKYRGKDKDGRLERIYELDGLKIYNEIGDFERIYCTYGNLGESELSKGNITEAYTWINKAISHQKTNSLDLMHKYPLMHKLFIESKHNYSYAIRELNKFCFEEGVISAERILREYIYFTTQYIYGNTKAERTRGLSNLKTLMNKAHFKLESRTIEETLNTKNIQIFLMCV